MTRRRFQRGCWMLIVAINALSATTATLPTWLTLMKPFCEPAGLSSVLALELLGDACFCRVSMWSLPLRAGPASTGPV